MKNFRLWQTWLAAFSLIIVVFGLALALFPRSGLINLVINRWTDPVFWPSGIPAPAASFQAWVYAVLGATMAGWGVILLAIAAIPFKARQKWAWRALALAIGLWYAVDTSLSAAHGVWFNVGFNTLILTLAGLPLVMTKREFEGR